MRSAFLVSGAAFEASGEDETLLDVSLVEDSFSIFSGFDSCDAESSAFGGASEAACLAKSAAPERSSPSSAVIAIAVPIGMPFAPSWA